MYKGTISLVVYLVVWKPLKANVQHTIVCLFLQREKTDYLLPHYWALFLMFLLSKAAKAPKQCIV